MPIHAVTGRIIESKFKVDLFELGCCTGFYNGEGCCYLQIMNNRKSVLGTIQRQRPKLTISITQKYPNELKRFNRCLLNKGYIYSRNRIDKTHYYELYFSGFEKVQFVIACMWKGLSGEKKEQYREILRRYMEELRKFGVNHSRAHTER